MKRELFEVSRKELKRLRKKTHRMRHPSEWSRVWSGREGTEKASLTRQRERESRRLYLAECQAWN